MSEQTADLAILFADITGSTRLYDQLGDREAREIVAKCIAILVTEVAAHQGTLIKTIGDEIMCTFPTAAAAMGAAMGMHRAMEREQPGGNNPIYIHAGFHFGTVICEGGDVYGDAVNVAARITHMTRSREILTTQDTVQLLPAEMRDKVRQIFRAELKGKEGEIGMFRVVWDMDDTLLTRKGRTSDRGAMQPHVELVLRYRGHTYRVNEQHRTVLLGRSPACEIAVSNFMASREHARIEFRFGKYVIVDFSANGTYLRFKDGHVVELAHEETVLHGAGTISLGNAFTEDMNELVEFEIQ